MKKLLALLALLSTQAFAWDQRAPAPVQQCQVHSPYGFAQTRRTAQPICREAYLVAYDAPVKIPVYVAYTLEPSKALGCFPRTNAFVADQSVPNGAASFQATSGSASSVAVEFTVQQPHYQVYS